MCVVNKDDAREPIEVQEGENVTLVAQLSQEKTCVQWLKNRQPLCPGPRMIMSSEGLVHRLTIQQSEPCDCGMFSCNTGDDEVHYTINVQGKNAHLNFKPDALVSGLRKGEEYMR